MPKCFARVIAGKWNASLLAAAASNRIENPAARLIGPFVTEDACPPLTLCVSHKKFMTAATRLRYWTQRHSEAARTVTPVPVKSDFR
jgi:hypothetical protein